MYVLNNRVCSLLRTIVLASQFLTVEDLYFGVPIYTKTFVWDSPNVHANKWCQNLPSLTNVSYQNHSLYMFKK